MNYTPVGSHLPDGQRPAARPRARSYHNSIITHSEENLMNTWAHAASTGAGVLCLVIAGLIWTVGDRHTPRVVAFLVLGGAALVLDNSLGRWVRHTSLQINGAVGAWIGQWTGVAILAIAGIAAAYVFFVHVWKGRVDEHTLLSAALLPLTVTSIPGSVGEILSRAVLGLGNLVGALIAAAFGLH